MLDFIRNAFKKMLQAGKRILEKGNYPAKVIYHQRPPWLNVRVGG